MAVKPIPEGRSTVSPYLVVERAPLLIDFLTRTFGAAELGRAVRPDGAIMHAEVKIGDSVVMLADATSQFAPVRCMVHVYVEDADKAYRRALEAGATSIMEPADQPDGDRRGGVTDPFGNQWWIATHVRDVVWSNG